MRLLSRAIKTASTGGATLPTVWHTFAAQQIAFRRGEVSMIAGPPGAGKSTFMMLRILTGMYVWGENLQLSSAHRLTTSLETFSDSNNC